MLVITEAVFKYVYASISEIKIPAIRCLLEQRDYYLKYEQYAERLDMENYLRQVCTIQLDNVEQLQYVVAYCLALKDYYQLSNEEIAKLFLKLCKKKWNLC
ncbi:MAG: hypothetical protein ACI35O_01165 [Bacillaceae bacterium]